ncbi:MULTISPECIES: histidinol-phosphate transaminase [Paenibacillus]|uniref:histidinol-phosphate transaminase n=1 Tax=Paenibacillus TaxID=44249 RepID=UPI0022B8DD12|nr:histidinol-phosphate transaminase [Paenibacillus caseinilyticus]MCZ8522703.1 histidinol-phosphate transaminase [Paenibacillus caseinilyticus]
MYIKPSIEQLEPYVPGIQPPMNGRVIKINANENPYPPSPCVKELLSSFDASELRYYPDAASQPLRELIAAHFDLPYGHVFAGNGSDEVISYLFRVCFEEHDRIATPYPTYTLYKTIADIHRVRTAFVETADDFTIDVKALARTGAKGIFIANPNAQTGLMLPLAEIEELLQSYDGLVVIDEAYIDFAPAGSSAASLIGRYPNLVVLRTFSKSYSLCGIRVGFCLADPKLVGALDKCRDSYNVSHLSQLLAAAAFEDQPYLQSTTRRVIATRDRVSQELVNLGFEVTPSQANFLLCKPVPYTAKDLYEFLKAGQVYVRYFDSPRLSDKLRITIGTEEEMDVLLQLIRHYADAARS